MLIYIVIGNLLMFSLKIANYCFNTPFFKRNNENVKVKFCLNKKVSENQKFEFRKTTFFNFLDV